VFVIGNMVMLVPGDLGIFLERVMPGNAGGALASPVPFNPHLLDAWPSFGIFVAEIAAVLGAAWLLLRRRDA
jgi:ABC-2 type transport system permease protein